MLKIENTMVVIRHDIKNEIVVLTLIKKFF